MKKTIRFFIFLLTTTLLVLNSNAGTRYNLISGTIYINYPVPTGGWSALIPMSGGGSPATMRITGPDPFMPSSISVISGGIEVYVQPTETIRNENGENSLRIISQASDSRLVYFAKYSVNGVVSLFGSVENQ